MTAISSTGIISLIIGVWPIWEMIKLITECYEDFKLRSNLFNFF